MRTQERLEKHLDCSSGSDGERLLLLADAFRRLEAEHPTKTHAELLQVLRVETPSGQQAGGLIGGEWRWRHLSVSRSSSIHGEGPTCLGDEKDQSACLPSLVRV